MGATNAYWLVSVNHLHESILILAAANAFGRLCSPRTVVTGPSIHLWRLLRTALGHERMATPGGR